MTRAFMLAATLVAGLVLGSTFPSIQAPIKSAFASLGISTAVVPLVQSEADHDDHKEAEGLIHLSADQIAAAQIEIAPAAQGVLSRRLTAPAVITPDPDKIGRVAAKVTGTIAEMRKRLGETVVKGEVIAVIDSREVAEAKSAFLASAVNHELQNDLFQREKMLFDRKISAEQQFLRVRAATTESRLQHELARQKLAALDLSDAEVDALSRQPVEALRRKEIRAPISGRIIERRVDLGAPVGGEGQEKELYVIANLSDVWADLSVPTTDLSLVHEGQTVRAAFEAGVFEGPIVFVSPILNQDTRSARVIARFGNKDLALRPGTYLTAQISLTSKPAGVKVPKAAIQSVDGKQVVFVRNPEGFEKREVMPGASDEDGVEILSGLDPGELIATTNTFTLKADLGKAEAEHAH